MYRIIISLLLGAVLTTSAAAGVTHKNYGQVKRGLPTGIRVQYGPVQADLHLTTPARPCDDDCGTVEPPTLNASAPSVGYFFTPPGKRQQKSDQTYAGGGSINTEGARSIRIFVMPDARWNVQSVTVQYGSSRVVSKPGRAAVHSETFATDGFVFGIGGLNGIRMIKITIVYEDFQSRVVGKRIDCLTVDVGQLR